MSHRWRSSAGRSRNGANRIPGSAMLSQVRQWVIAPLATLIAASFVLYTAVWLQPGNPLTVLLGTKASAVQPQFVGKVTVLGLAHQCGARQSRHLTRL